MGYGVQKLCTQGGAQTRVLLLLFAEIIQARKNADIVHNVIPVVTRFIARTGNNGEDI